LRRRKVKLAQLAFKISIFILVSLLSCELFSFIGTKLNLFIYNTTPLFYLTSHDGTGAKWRTEKEAWGAWHKLNFTDTYVSDCFNTVLKSNNVGARDSEFIQPTKSNSIVLLGDSFAEGHGVNFNDTAQTHIENLTGLNILNFGSGGNFGPVQYYELYKNLASKYEHDAVMVFFLPGNDFTDNDYEAYKLLGRDKYLSGRSRYRPYWKSFENNYETFYPEDAIPSENFGHLEEGLFGQFKRFLIRYTYSSNPIRSGYALRDLWANKKSLDYAGYYDSTEDQQKAVVFYIKKLFKLAKESRKKNIIVLIPGIEDIARFKVSGNQYEEQFWYRNFSELASLHGVQIIDLMKFLPLSDSRPLFLECDPHWSPHGNKWAGEIISKHLIPK